ncbi:MAG: M48 family metalloprotease [Pseudodesulfovibrio sp.]|uniref:Zn-dependent protease n=2 Tax=Pseudodesulfovibrio indicus TaxID=1716143 RepID=A0AA94PMZ3_9BACT|nr:M48 family metallopeptidase [Pseudodesulfovibrio indicus]TDT90791.1 putative Zn-dependent protease [Pseudodesulfovibrio indicus]
MITMIAMRTPLAVLPALLAALLLVVAPATSARADLLGDKLTLRDENKMGREFDTIIRSQMPMVGDTYITDYVAEVVTRVVTGKRPMPYQIKSAVIANPLINAFAIPGGFIYIFTGLIQDVETESQLAGVVAHELAHVSQRHVVNRLEKQKKISLLSTAGILAGVLLGVATGGSSGAAAGQALMIGSSGVATAAMLHYSQEDEREADQVGMNSLVKAGYNPEGMPQTFEIMLKNKWYDSSSSMPSYLSTHPGTEERIGYLNDRIARMPTEFTTRKDDNTRLKRVQVLVRSRMSPANTALAYWDDMKQADYTAMDWVGRGVTLERLKRIEEAQKAFDSALAMDRNDQLVVREAGIFYFKTGRPDQALPLLQQAAIMNQRDAMALFYLARLQAEAKQYGQAAKNMTKVNELVPEDWEVHQHLGMILGESGDAFSGNLHLAYSGVYSMDLGKARRYMNQAQALATTEAQKEQLQQLSETIKTRAALKK